MTKPDSNTKSFSPLLIIVVFLVIFVSSLAVFYAANHRQTPTITAVASIRTYDACTKDSGSKILETYPEQCVTTDGQRFTAGTANNKVDTSAPITTIKLSQAPPELQKAVIDFTEDHSPSCVKERAIVDFNGNSTDQAVMYYGAGWAKTTIGCDGGAATIFAQNTTGWVQIDSTQSNFSCKALESFMTPKKFLAAVTYNQATTCADESGKLRELQS